MLNLKEIEAEVNQNHRNGKEKLLKEFKGEDLSGELLYFQIMEFMKEKTTERFPEADENYIDALLEEYYNTLDI